MGIKIFLGKKSNKGKICLGCFVPTFGVCNRCVFCGGECVLVRVSVIIFFAAAESNVEVAVGELFKLLSGNFFLRIAVGNMRGEGGGGSVGDV